jgi:DNA-binding beta-propeller fold protein YncE
MYTSADGRFVYVSRPSLADVVGIELATGKVVWRFPMEGQRSDHMATSPDGTKLLVSDSTANKVHQLDAATGKKTGEFPSGDSPHESVFSKDGKRIYHASIGRVYTPTDAPQLGLLRDTSKGARYFQVVDADSMQVVKRWDMGEKLEEAGFPDLESAVRPMAITPDEQRVFLQVSFFHGLVEFDLASEKVVRVVDLPISDEARALRPEQYLLDSAHHGLAIDPTGTKLCVAGTMSDYATIVDRETLKPGALVPGEKPYWSTVGVDGNCWVSYSGSDEAAVIDFKTGREVARIPVGDHPQRIRIGAVNEVVLRTLAPPSAPAAADKQKPRVSVHGPEPLLGPRPHAPDAAGPAHDPRHRGRRRGQPHGRRAALPGLPLGAL